MFKDFLLAYIPDLIECSDNKYDVREDIIDDIADTIESNEYIWDIIDSAIYDELARYKIMESENND